MVSPLVVMDARRLLHELAGHTESLESLMCSFNFAKPDAT
jgi:hypothetical protein